MSTETVIKSKSWTLDQNSLGDNGLQITMPVEGVTISIHDEIYTFESREDLRYFISYLQEASAIYGVFDDPAEFETFTF